MHQPPPAVARFDGAEDSRFPEMLALYVFGF